MMFHCKIFHITTLDFNIGSFCLYLEEMVANYKLIDIGKRRV